MLPSRVAILGLGLIGGSVARALRVRQPATRTVAWTPTGRGPAEAYREGVIDFAAPSLAEALADSDLVVLAGPPLAILELLETEGDPLRAAAKHGSTVTDVASTKAEIVARADGLGLPFVGGHPMAGREASGFEAADADLFVGRPWVVVPGVEARADDVERVESLAEAVGAAPVRLGAAEHDTAVAAISHLPLAAAAALVEAVTVRSEWPVARRLAAGGWDSMTRLARGDPAMGAGILATNRDAVARELRAFRDAIDDWLEALDETAPDARSLAAASGPIRARLERARAALGNDAGG